MSGSLLAILSGVAGAVLLLAIILLRYCLWRREIRLTSEVLSSDPSQQVEQTVDFPSAIGTPYLLILPGASCFTLEELSLATKDFSSTNLIGYGKFGEVHLGLLQDGVIVAIKRRQAVPSGEFIEEVHHLASIRHRNIVSLLGYYQQNNQQMLIYEHVPNGSVSTHLYGASQRSSKKLEFKHRLSIAHGAAKGLDHLHGQSPPLLHMDFKTGNVLVDEDFIPKVADAGLKNLLDRTDGARSSTHLKGDDLFLDPEVKESGSYSSKSDIYSFGVFLLELVSGREAKMLEVSGSNQIIGEWVRNIRGSGDFSAIVDQRMGHGFTAEGMKDVLHLLALCMDASSERRPTMHQVVLELERIREKEISLTTIMGDVTTTTVTLGSQLFTAS